VAELFDPYHIWLGIPPAEQPADNYRLLGVSRFEANEEVITNAADQRVRHIRSMQTGKRQAESQKLLSEIAQAAATLLDPDKKRQYDAGMAAKETLPSAPPPRQQVGPATPARPRATFLEMTGQQTPVKWLLIAGACTATVALFSVSVGIVWMRLHRAKEIPVANVVMPNATPSVATTPDIARAVVSPPAITAPSPAPMPTVPPVPPPDSVPPEPPANPVHQQNWEYGYGRLDASGTKVSEFHQLGYSAELHQDGTSTIRWGVAPRYPADGPLDILHLRKDGGHTANDPSIVVVRRWRHPEASGVKVSGFVELPESGGDGVRARLLTGHGQKIWEATVKGPRVNIEVAKMFVLQENEPLDLCIDSGVNHSYDTFKSRLHLAVLMVQKRQKDEWDSLSDYRPPVPPSMISPPAADTAPDPAVTVKPEKQPRLPVPSEAALTAARAQLNETFGDMAGKSKKPDEKLKLATEMRGLAASEKDPAIRFAALDAARRLAMDGHDLAGALQLAGEIARQYELDPLEQQLQTLKLVPGLTMPSATWEEAAGYALGLAETGLDASQTELADAASLLAIAFASKGKNLEQRKQAKKVRDTVLAYKKSAALVHEAEETLKTKQDDAAANLVVGKWRCFILEEWKTGLPALEKCGEPALVTAAMAERDPKNSLAIADAWYASFSKLQETERAAAQRRALTFYAQSATQLTGLDQLRASKRVEELKASTVPKSSAKSGPEPPLPDDKLAPGLIVRIVSGSQAVPTPILGTTMNWDGIVWDNVEVESRKVLDLREISASPLATGYIELDSDDTVVFTLRNAYCLIDGTNFPPLVAAGKGEDTSYFKGHTEARWEKQLTKGRHTLVIGRIPINTGREMGFKVKRRGGGDCLFHSPKILQAELAKSVRLPGGSTSKGVLLFGNLRFSR